MSFHSICLKELGDAVCRNHEYMYAPGFDNTYFKNAKLVSNLLLTELSRCPERQNFDIRELNECCFKVAAKVDAVYYPILNDSYEYLRGLAAYDNLDVWGAANVI